MVKCIALLTLYCYLKFSLSQKKQRKVLKSIKYLKQKKLLLTTFLPLKINR